MLQNLVTFFSGALSVFAVSKTIEWYNKLPTKEEKEMLLRIGNNPYYLLMPPGLCDDTWDKEVFVLRRLVKKGYLTEEKLKDNAYKYWRV